MKNLTLLLLLVTSSLVLKSHPEVISARDSDTVNVTVYTNQCYYSQVLPGVTITLTSTEAPFNTYTEVSNQNGIAYFDSVVTGTYDVAAEKPGYRSVTHLISIQMDYTVTFELPKKAYPVRNLVVDPKTSIATWDAPLVVSLVTTSFEGTFPPQTSGQWSLNSDGEGWYKSSTADSMLANWIIPEWPDHYAVVNHDYSTQGGSYDFLITPELDLRERDDFVLYFDSYFDSFYGGVATIEYSTDSGVTWNLLKQLEPDTVWKRQSVDLSALSGDDGLKNVKLAFHFVPGNGPLFDGWAVDNVEVLSNDPARVTEYHLFVLGTNIELSLPPEKTSYRFSDLVYGETYNMGIFTRNDCGASESVFYQWQSTYLYPPRNVRDEYVYNTDMVSLFWDLPAKGDEGPVTVYGINNSENMYSSFKSDNTTVIEPLVAYTAGNFVNAGEFKNGSDDTMYFVDNAGMVDEVKVDFPFEVTPLGNCGLTGASGMALDYSTGIYYLSLTNGDLYTIDFSDLSTSFVGSSAINNLIGITFAGDSNLYGYNVAENTFYMIDKETAAATVIGDIGFSAGYGQGLGYDKVDDMVVMSAYNEGTGQAEYRSVDLATGMTTLLGVIGPAGTQFGTIAMPALVEVPDGLLSFNVYRDDNLISNIIYEGELPPYQPEFDDFPLQPGTYIYKVSALYDLTQFGYSGEVGESCFDNDTVVVIWGFALPFTEEWNSGNFDVNYWTTDSPNWVINNSTGDGAPSAEFTNMPHLENGYESSLTSAPFRVDSLSEGSFWLDFNLKLDDLNQTGKERLSIEVFDGNGWHQVGDVANNGSFDFDEGFNHIEITRYVRGNTFYVRFKATGQNSTDIQSWYVDNINIYRTCDPPKDLEGTYVWKQGGDYGVQLCWEAPSYPYFNSDWINWDKGENYSAIAACSGFSAAIRWDAGMLDEQDGDYITAVNFYTCTLGYDSLVLKVWKDTSASELVYRQDVSSKMKPNSWNMIWLQTPVEIEADKELWVGYTIYGAVAGIFTAGTDKGPAIVGYGDKIGGDGMPWDNLSDFGLSYNWNIQALVEPLNYQPEPLPLLEDDYVSCSYRSTPVLGEINENGKTASSSFNRDLEGFKVYRSESGEEGSYVEYATVPYEAVRDKYCYFDHEPNVQSQTSYWYKVSAIRNSETDGCESAFANSKLMPDEDFVVVLVTGVDDPKEEEIAVYPNPASDWLNIESTEAIAQITVYDFSGKTVFDQTINNYNKFVLNTGTFHAGVYITRIKTGNREMFKRFVIVR